MNPIVKILMGDPGETSDPSGFVGIEGDCRSGKIKLKIAKEITDKNPVVRLEKTAQFLKWVKENVRPTFMGMETNNDGAKIIAKLKRYGISLHGIHTSANMTEESRQKGRAMDKPYMIKYFGKKKNKHDIIYPEKLTKDMQKLIDQIPQIGSFRTPAGNISYRAQRGRHDDLFMALLLCLCVFIIYKRKWDELQ